MKNNKKMADILIIGGLVIIAIGTFIFWFGGNTKSKQDIAVLRTEGQEQNESLKNDLASHKEQIIELKTGNNELLSVNKSLKQTVEVQTSLINELQAEITRLENLGNLQLKTIYYTEELNQEVKAIFIRFKLKEDEGFNSLCPIKFGLQFSFPNHTSLSFKKLVTDAEAFDSKKNRFCAYQVHDIEDQEGNPHFSHTLNDIRKEFNINNITIQILVTSEMKGSIRDFHDELLSVYFPKELYQKIESIQLIVNGWIILNEDFSNVDWRSAKIPWLSLKYDDMEMYQAINKGPHERPPFTQWNINLYNNLPEFLKEFSQTQFFGSLADKLQMIRR